MLTDLISQIHLDCHGIYGACRIHAELTLGRGVVVGHNQAELLMRRAGLQGLTGRRKWKRIHAEDVATDLVERDFNRAVPTSSGSPDHRAPNPRGEGLLLRHPRRLLATCRRLVHRRSSRYSWPLRATTLISR